MLNKSSISKATASTRIFNQAQVTAMIRLFKVVPTRFNSNPQIISSEDALLKGLVFLSPDGDVMDEIPATIYHIAVDLYGNNKELFNKTFYNSFATVREMSVEERVFDQIMHYISTYGADQLGVGMPTYIPAQALTDIPEALWGNKNFKFVVIQFMTNKDCVERLNKYLTTLTAPSAAIRESIEILLPLATLDTDDIKSFEIQVMQHQRLGTVPKNPVSQLRYLVFVTTGETLIIKNKNMRLRIQSAACKTEGKAASILLECDSTGLASIFLRYKPIFLAFKTHKGCAPLINRLRRLADTYHQPLAAMSLQNLTSCPTTGDVARIISRASTRDLIKVLNSVRAKLNSDYDTPGVYAIRNGRTFVKENGAKSGNENTLTRLGAMLHSAIVQRLRDTIGGRTFYMPDYIDYAVPTTEKQFVGNIPYGSRINGTPNGAFTIGVHWFNQKGDGKGDQHWGMGWGADGDRVDIDLHMNSATRHFGWNGYYGEGSDGDVIYTGDMTNAPLPNGAAEAYWFNPKTGEKYIVTANLYAGNSDIEYKLFMTEVKPGNTRGDRGYNRGRQAQHYTYNPNETLFPAIPLKFRGDERAMTIGMFADGCFYFYGGTLSNGIVPQANYAQFLEGLTAQLDTKLLLRDLIEECGGFVIDSTDDMEAEELTEVISLAPEDLAVDTLLNIVDGVTE